MTESSLQVKRLGCKKAGLSTCLSLSFPVCLSLSLSCSPPPHRPCLPIKRRIRQYKTIKANQFVTKLVLRLRPRHRRQLPGHSRRQRIFLCQERSDLGAPLEKQRQGRHVWWARRLAVDVWDKFAAAGCSASAKVYYTMDWFLACQHKLGPGRFMLNFATDSKKSQQALVLAKPHRHESQGR